MPSGPAATESYAVASALYAVASALYAVASNLPQAHSRSTESTLDDVPSALPRLQARRRCFSTQDRWAATNSVTRQPVPAARESAVNNS